MTGEEARERLEKLLGHGAEKRKEQFEYTTQVSAAFAPMREEGEPNVVLAEAGTGIGKTLGYLAPASVWAEKDAGTVWISTYTKNLQRQIDQELDRLYPNQDVKDAHVAIRKGRENYLCLLNFEESAAGAGLARSPVQAVAAGLMTRWVAATKHGDLTGADFRDGCRDCWVRNILWDWPTGAANVFIRPAITITNVLLSDRCVNPPRARIVVANHALVMIQSAISSTSEDMPTRYIFDEGHHIFEAADSAFAAHLTAGETRDLRRWILGAEGGRRTRARGLFERGRAGGRRWLAEKALQDILHFAGTLTGEGWQKRLRDGSPFGPTEEFLALVYKQVYARAVGGNPPTRSKRRPIRSMMKFWIRQMI